MGRRGERGHGDGVTQGQGDAGTRDWDWLREIDTWELIIRANVLISPSPLLPVTLIRLTPSPRHAVSFYRLRGVGRVARVRIRCCHLLRVSSEASSICFRASLNVSPPNCRIFK